MRLLYSNLYFGGVPSRVDAALALQPQFSGCIGDATLNGVVVNFANLTDTSQAIVGKCLWDEEIKPPFSIPPGREYCILTAVALGAQGGTWYFASPTHYLLFPSSQSCHAFSYLVSPSQLWPFLFIFHGIIQRYSFDLASVLFTYFMYPLSSPSHSPASYLSHNVQVQIQLYIELYVEFYVEC